MTIHCLLFLLQIYQLLSCIFCCQLLCLYPQTQAAKSKRAKAFKRYLATIKKANEIFFKHNIKLDLKTMLTRYKKRNHKARYRRKRNVHVNYTQHIIMTLPTNVIKCRIFCRSGLYLQLLPDGLVKGTTNHFDKYGEYCYFDDADFEHNLRVACRSKERSCNKLRTIF